jgi:8-amino-7-oxononanoate synthase
VDLFEKCRSFTRADEVKAMGCYPYFHAIEESEGPVVKIEGRSIVMAGSNNYLGLTAHPKVKEAAIAAVKKYGTGCSGSRYLTGTLDLHVELERRLAIFMGKEDCLLYSTGYQTPQGILPTLVGKGEYLISDKDNHASIVAGALVTAGQASYLADGDQSVQRYKHNDMNHLDVVLSKLPLDAAKLIVSDGVFSTSGEIVDLPNLVRVAKKYNAKVLVLLEKEDVALQVITAWKKKLI